MKNIIKLFLNLILISIFCFSTYKIYEKLSAYKISSKTYTSLKLEETESLYSINKDFKFWINIDNTNIDYPVVQGIDNEYYLDKDFNNNENPSGSIFIDYRNKSGDKNLILYGHNMKNKTMFNNLLKFKDKNFFKDNNNIKIKTNTHNYIYQVFSVYTTSTDYDYLIPNFENDQDFINYINSIKTKSVFDSGVDININDSIITLSTCSYEFDNARTVIHAKLIN